MALITDPDNLGYEKTYTGNEEMYINASAKTIQLVRVGNLSADGVTLKCFYSKLKEIWKTDTDLIKYAFPMLPITDEQYIFQNGWNLDKTGSGSDYTPNLIRTGGWAVEDTSGNITEMWAGVVTLGSIQGSGQVYYVQSSGGSSSNFNLTGAVNQAIQIYRDDDGDGNTSEDSDYDKRTYLEIFLRSQGNTYAYQELSDIGVTTMTYQVYRFPISDDDDIDVTHTDNTISTTTPYTGMSITWYAAAQSIAIGGSNYDFHVIIDGNSGTAEEIYEFVQYQLRQSGDIDAGAGTKTGKTTNQLLEFVGDTLYTLSDSTGGVYIENFLPADTNRLVFTDDTAAERTFPYVATLTLNFGANLVADADAVYRVFFTNDDAGTDQGYDFGTANAITVDDNDGVDMAGTVSAQSSVQHSFDYDGNVQRGAGSDGEDAPITVVAIGLSTGQYVSATGTITRSTTNAVTLTAPLERNYANV